MDTGVDAGSSGRKESLTGDAVIDNAKEYEAENVRESREQGAGSCAPNQSVTSDKAVNSAERAQLDDAPRPDAADEEIRRQYTQSMSGNSKSSSKNVAGARANDGESVDQTARPGEPDPAHRDGAATQGDEAGSGAGAGAGAGPSWGPTGDSVIDIDGSQGSESASGSDDASFMLAGMRSRYVEIGFDDLQMYWFRLKSTAGNEDWEEHLDHPEASLSDDDACVLTYLDDIGWRPLSWVRPRKLFSACLGFNVGLASILHLGATFDIDPEFFRDHIMYRVREGPVISNSQSGIWCHLAFSEDGPLLSSATDPSLRIQNTTFFSIYWPKRGQHWRPVLALVRNPNVVKLEELKGQRTRSKPHQKNLFNALRDGLPDSKHWAIDILCHPLLLSLLKIPENREIQQFLLDESESPSELFPILRKPLGFARFVMDWLSGQVGTGVLPSISHPDVALLHRSPTRGRLEMLQCSINLEIWQYITALIEQEAARLADQAIVEPTFTTFRSLNQCRQLVNRFISIEKDPKNGYRLGRLCDERKARLQICDTQVDLQVVQELMPAEDFDNEAQMIRDKLAALESRLKETFTLLVQAVTVVDSDANKKAASRASLLTLLAALYLPATLATGIFGMNVKLFTGDANSADWRPVIYTFLVVLAPSVAFIGYIFLPRRKQRPARW